MIKKLFSSQLRINMVSGVVVTIINIAVLALSYPIYLHFLGYEQYGVWLVLSVVLSFAQLGNLGISQAVMKLVAEEYGRNDLKAIEQYMTTAIVVLAASGAAILAIVILFKRPITGLFKLSDADATTTLWLLPYMASLSVYVFIVQAVNSALSGLGRMDLANYVQTGGRFIAVLVGAFLLVLGVGIESLFVGSVVSYVFVHAMSIVFIRRIAPVRTFGVGNLSLKRTKRLLCFGSGILGSSLLSMLLSPFNKLMLSRYAGVASVPVYEIAYTGSMQVRALAEVGIRALMPEVSRIGANMTGKAMARICEINHRAVGLIVRFAVPFYVLLFLVSPLLLRLWLAGRFVETLPLSFRIALVASLLSLACVPAYYLLLGLGKVRQCLGNHLILAAVNAILILAFARMDNHLTLDEVFSALVIGTSISSTYILFCGRRFLRGSQTKVSILQGPIEEVSVCSRETSAASTCL
jgi:O-antigen/teichoic acid export membrane protein